MAAPEPLHLRVFISSPGDVADERDLARALLKDKLPYDPLLRGDVSFDVVSWDDPAAPTPMPAHLTPQEAVNRGLPKPSECDFVVVVLWSRMGTPLPAEYRKANGEPYLSGTEWEYEDALSSTREPRPEVLVYRRTEKPKIEIDDPKSDEKREQWARVEGFFQRFRNPDGSLIGGCDKYATPAEFAEKLASHLRTLLRPRLDALRGHLIHQKAHAAEVDPATLAAARARLAEMPVDAIPDPAPLPPGSWMPRGRNDLFVGRADDLRVLATALKAGATAAVGQIAAATGLGGIGKTQLANEFVHRYGQYFAGGVFWLSFANLAAVRAEVAGCGGAGALELRPDFGGLPLDDQVRLVRAAWQSPLPRLLVFDNCEDEKLLETWRPSAGGSRVLVTSRRAGWSRGLGVRALRLGVLARAESRALLHRHRPDLAPDDPDLDAIAAELGDLPLALHLAGSYLERYRHAGRGRPAAYLAALRRPDLLEHLSMTASGDTPTGHEQHVARTFALSYGRLKPDDPTDATALALLARAACFAPGEPIPRDLLCASLGPTAEETDGDEAAEARAEDALARLGELGLVEAREETGALVLHRLLAAFVRRKAGEAAAAEARAAVEEAVLVEARRLNHAGYPAPLLAWQPHLRAVAEAAAAGASERAGSLYVNLGYHLAMIADFAGARAAYERALAIWERALGPEHPQVATAVNNLGSVLHDQGELAGARAAFERALRIDEAAYGPDHPNVARDVNNLGDVLQAQGDLAGARAAYERALAIIERALGPEHPNVATAVNNLGMVLRAQSDLAGAKAAFERALRIDEAALGPDHPEVATDVNNLGLVLHDQGELAGAKAAFERALAIFEHARGPRHPSVAAAANNLGVVLRAQSDPAGARAAFERALRIDEAALGPDHPNVANRLWNLGHLLGQTGERDAGIGHLSRALTIFERALGPEHPDTRGVRGHLAALSGDTDGDRAED